jgi:large subunit ribosomal protein L22
MQVTSTYRFARISAFKAREVTREIQGHSASEALDLLTFSPKKAAQLVKKTLKSAIANAENNAELRVDTLLVKEAVVGEGPTFKRFRARARGGASPLLKRTSHIRIVLSDELAPEPPVTSKKRSKSVRQESTRQRSKEQLETARQPVAEAAPAPAENSEAKADEPTAQNEPTTKAEPSQERQ